MALPHGGVIGTAGHIDHGKTALVHALTGIDTDRLKEEKARGITIELGFAHLELPSGRTVGVVDVPGHERYVRAMVAGAVGLDLVVLVVAADEGVMPQTREHLDICGLLGVRRGLVALTKVDRVEPGLEALAEADVRAALVGTFLESAPIVRCSARSGIGLDALRTHIDELLSRPNASLLRDPDAYARLPVDRVFTMKGFGSVVTGTLWSGRLTLDDDVSLQPEQRAGDAKIRGLQCHGAAVNEAVAGQRIAVNVGWPREAVERGQVLGRAGTLVASRLFDARVQLLRGARRPMKRRSEVLLHAGTVQLAATVRLLDTAQLLPGEVAYAEIEAASALVLYPGDRFVLRGFAAQKDHGTTTGGGEVVRVLGENRSRRGARTDTALLDANWRALRDGDVASRVLFEVERTGPRGVDRGQLAQRLPFSPKIIEQTLVDLSSKQQVLRFDRERGAYLSKRDMQRLSAAVLAQLAAHHRLSPLDEGLSSEALRTVVGDDPRLLHLVIESLREAGSLEKLEGRVRLARNDSARTASHLAVDDLGRRLLARLLAAGLQPPRVEELDTHVDTKAALESLVKQGLVLRVKDLYFAAAAVESLRGILVAHLEQHGTIDPQSWKAMCGASRKYSIPLAEHFDAVKVTLRVGDLRRLRSR